MRWPDGSVSSFTPRIAATAVATAVTSETASPAPTGGGAFCRMIGRPPSAATRAKNAIRRLRSRPRAGGAMTMAAVAPRRRPWAARAAAARGSSALAPTITGSRPRAASATVSRAAVRSSTVSRLNSLATPG